MVNRNNDAYWVNYAERRIRPKRQKQPQDIYDLIRQIKEVGLRIIKATLSIYSYPQWCRGKIKVHRGNQEDEGWTGGFEGRRKIPNFFFRYVIIKYDEWASEDRKRRIEKENKDVWGVTNSNEGSSGDRFNPKVEK